MYALQHTAAHCNTLQYHITQCTTLHHIAEIEEMRHLRCVRVLCLCFVRFDGSGAKKTQSAGLFCRGKESRIILICHCSRNRMTRLPSSIFGCTAISQAPTCTSARIRACARTHARSRTRTLTHAHAHMLAHAHALANARTLP